MPIIPLLKRNTEAPMRGMPALDNYKRGEVDLRGLRQGIGGLAEATMLEGVDDQAFVAEAGAMGNVGRALSGNADVIGRAIGDAGSVMGGDGAEAGGGAG